MTLEEVVIAIARIAGSLPVLWWPLGGGILAVLVDFSDLFMMNLLDLGGVRDYQAFDKWVDQVYMVAFLVVALRWKGVPRYVAIGLFAYRIVGFAYFRIRQFLAWHFAVLPERLRVLVPVCCRPEPLQAGLRDDVEARGAMVSAA